MGQLTDARIKAWQQHAGIQPATGARLELLDRMAHKALELIRILERERSGIRAGDGHWYPGDPVSGVIEELRRLEQRDLAAWREEATQRRKEMQHDGASY